MGEGEFASENSLKIKIRLLRTGNFCARFPQNWELSERVRSRESQVHFWNQTQGLA